jgi:SAM-dependent methyltransferase
VHRVVPRPVALVEDTAANEPAGILRTSADENEYVERNRVAWEQLALSYIATARKAWSAEELRWGIWGAPESQIGVLDDYSDREADIIELGCGTAGLCASFARAGLRPVALDFARTQLRTALQLQREFGIAFRLIHSEAEDVPFESGSFDAVVSEYGPSLWCDPRRWLPEAHRILRGGGQLIFVTNSPFLMAATPADGGPARDRLVRDFAPHYRAEFPGITDAVEFHASHGHWLRLLRAVGFVVEDLIEVMPPEGAMPRQELVSLEWARRWPSEDIWVARKPS